MNKYVLSILLLAMPIMGMEKELGEWNWEEAKTALANIATWNSLEKSVENYKKWFGDNNCPVSVKNAADKQMTELIKNNITGLMEWSKGTSTLGENCSPVVAKAMQEKFNALIYQDIKIAGIVLLSVAALYASWRLYKAYQKPASQQTARAQKNEKLLGSANMAKTK